VLLHSDQAIAQKGQQFIVKAGASSTMVNIIAPADRIARIVPNNVMAPGPPGSVDKGEVQVRGQKLEIFNAQQTRDLNLHFELTPNQAALAQGAL
jgi:hypothetical protein